MGSEVQKPYELITDFITGRKIPNIGAEEQRQAVERFLVEEKGYQPENIGVDVPLALEAAGEPYRTLVDLLISVSGKPFMLIKCAAGSLESREKEVVSAARIISDMPVPYAAVSDGCSAVIYDTLRRKKTAEGLDQIPDYGAAEDFMASYKPSPVDEKVLERDKIIFKSYDSMNVNVQRSLNSGQEPDQPRGSLE